MLNLHIARRIAWILTTCAILYIAAAPKSPDYVQIARSHLEELSKTARVTGSEAAVNARDYISERLEALGYTVTMQFFSHKGENANIIAEAGLSSVIHESDERQTIVIGAHYDSVDKDGSKGADDNASGTALMLALAETLPVAELPYRLVFVAFDAEEPGLYGSRYYVEELLESGVEISAMINLDCVISGDKLYVYTGRKEDIDLREFVLERAESLGFEFSRQPESCTYGDGLTGDWSDHAPFKRAGIPTLYFEATNWDIDPEEGNIQTEDHGKIIHTGRDTLEFMDANFPGRVDSRFDTFAQLLVDLLSNELPLPEAGIGGDDAIPDYIGLCGGFQQGAVGSYRI